MVRCRLLWLSLSFLSLACTPKAQDDPSQPQAPPASSKSDVVASTASLPASSLLADLATHHGKTVTLEGVVVAQTQDVRLNAAGTIERVGTSSPQCTELECGPQAPCCNTCQSAASLKIDGQIMVELMGDFGCEGTNCKLTCKPQLGARYVVTGVFQVQRFGGSGAKLQLKVTEHTKR